jgi:hypothetical protein
MTPVNVTVTQLQPHRFVRLPIFAAITGNTEKSAQEKISKGVWIEGREYIRAPDGHIHIDLKGYDRWLLREREPA